MPTENIQGKEHPDGGNVWGKGPAINRDMLMRHRLKVKNLEQLEELIQRIESRITQPPAARLCDMPRGGSSGGDALCRDIVTLSMLTDLYSTRWDELIDEREIINKAIAQLGWRERTLISGRYFDGLSWEEIANKIDCSTDHARGYLHSVVLKQIIATYSG